MRILRRGGVYSRDLDLLVLVDSENLDHLRQALEDLEAKLIAVPPLEAVYLRSGHAVHFRCSRLMSPGCESI